MINFLVMRPTENLLGVYPLLLRKMHQFLMSLYSAPSLLYETCLSNVDLHMCVEISFVVEALLTNSTFKWLLSCMKPHMSLQSEFGFECQLTIWPFADHFLNSFVKEYMSPQLISPCEYFPAARLITHNFLQTNSKYIKTNI
jgi:hypothetical protein